MTADDIVPLVAKEYGVECADIFGASRLQTIADARHMVAFLMSCHLSMTIIEISKFLNRSHATIIYSLNKMKGLLSYDKTTCNLYRNLVASLSNIG